MITENQFEEMSGALATVSPALLELQKDTKAKK